MTPMPSPAAEILPFTDRLPFRRVLNVGPGADSTATDRFLARGAEVVEVDIANRTQPRPGVERWEIPLWEASEMIADPFDCIWASHVLEHQSNPGDFLTDCRDLLAPGGWLCVIVPPAKHNIVGGHLTLWNLGLLIYHLILAGFDCRGGHFLTQGYNCVAFVQRRLNDGLPDLLHDCGDIELLADAGLWPEGLDARQGFDGQIPALNWPPPWPKPLPE